MRTGKFVQAVSIALASVCGMAAASRADDGQTTLPPPMVWSPPAGPARPYVEEHVTGSAAISQARPHPIWQGIKDCLQKHGWCCYSSSNTFTCGTCKSECRFIFGSCREFFGEPCLKGPPGPGDLAVTGYGNGCRHCAP